MAYGAGMGAQPRFLLWNGGLTRTWAICNDHLPLCVTTAVVVEQLRQAQDGLNAFDFNGHCLPCVPSENYKFLGPSEE